MAAATWDKVAGVHGVRGICSRFSMEKRGCHILANAATGEGCCHILANAATVEGCCHILANAATGGDLCAFVRGTFAL